MKKKNKYLLLFKCLFVWLLLSVSACKRMPVADSGITNTFTDISYFQAQYQQHAVPQNWQFSAKVGVSGHDGQSGQGNLLWRNNASDVNNIKLHGPFGAGAVKLIFDQQAAELIDAKGRHYKGQTAQSLLSEIVGWQVPFNELLYWLHALPNINSKVQYRLDAQGRLQWLMQQGWQVEFKEFSEYQGKVMPRKIFASKIDEAHTLSVRLVVKDWNWQ